MFLSHPRASSIVAVALAAAVQGAVLDGISLEPPVLPQVTSVRFVGSGCPQDTATVTRGTASWSDWVVSLRGFSLEVPSQSGGGGSTLAETCDMQAEFAPVSPGWQLALQTVSIRGYVALSSGSSLSTSATVSWSGPDLTSQPVVRNVSTVNSRGAGEASAVAAILDFSDVEPWSTCSVVDAPLGRLSVQFRVAVEHNGTAAGSYASFGGLAENSQGEISDAPAVVQRLQWTWRQCTPIMRSTTIFPKPKTTTKAASSSMTVTTPPTTATTAATRPPYANSTTPALPPYANSTTTHAVAPTTSRSTGRMNTTTHAHTSPSAANTTTTLTTPVVVWPTSHSTVTANGTLPATATSTNKTAASYGMPSMTAPWVTSTRSTSFSSFGNSTTTGAGTVGSASASPPPVPTATAINATSNSTTGHPPKPVLLRLRG